MGHKLLYIPWRENLIQALLENNRHFLAGLFANGLARLGFDRQHVHAVAHGHKRTAERLTVDSAANLDQPAGAKEFGRIWHYSVGPASFVLSFLERSGELLIEFHS